MSEARVKRLCKLSSKLEVPVDKRGRHDGHNTISEAIMQSVDAHIRSYPYRVAHYGKSGQKARYLHCDLSVRSMWIKFLEEYDPAACLAVRAKVSNNDVAPIVKYEHFLEYFRAHFNYKFGRPRVDVCSTCEKLEVKLKSIDDANEKVQLVTELQVHKAKANLFYKQMKECEIKVKTTEKGKSEMIVFDFMQNIPFPHVPVAEMFFLRQLWLYVFGIHRFSDGKAFFYTYDEIVAKKGVNEVVSMLAHFLAHHVGKDVRKLYVFSDACTGQNRNQTMVQFWKCMVESGRFDEVSHVFPTRGHSYMACDRDFGKIELKKRKQDVVYTPDQWVDIISLAHSNSQVVRCTRDMFRSFTCHLSPKFRTNGCSEDKSVKWKVSTYKSFLFQKGKPVVVSSTSSGFLVHRFKLEKPGVDFSLRCVPQAYQLPIQLKPAKLTDLQKVLDVIPAPHRKHFDDVIAQQLNHDPAGDEESGSDIGIQTTSEKA